MDSSVHKIVSLSCLDAELVGGKSDKVNTRLTCKQEMLYCATQYVQDSGQTATRLHNVGTCSFEHIVFVDEIAATNMKHRLRSFA